MVCILRKSGLYLVCNTDFLLNRLKLSSQESVIHTFLIIQTNLTALHPNRIWPNNFTSITAIFTSHFTLSRLFCGWLTFVVKPIYSILYAEPLFIKLHGNNYTAKYWENVAYTEFKNYLSWPKNLHWAKGHLWCQDLGDGTIRRLPGTRGKTQRMCQSLCSSSSKKKEKIHCYYDTLPNRWNEKVYEADDRSNFKDFA